MTATDEAGVHWSYLATEANFAFMKDLQARNLVVPVVGDFGGPKAIRHVAAYLKAHNATVSAFYLSNVEQYLDGKAQRLLPQRPVPATGRIQHLHSVIVSRVRRIRIRLRTRVCVEPWGNGGRSEELPLIRGAFVRLLLLWMSFVALAAQQSSGPSSVPKFIIDAPPELAAARARIEAFDTSRLRGVMQLLRIDDPGPDIRVVLASESSDWARQVPRSTAGFAVSEDNLVVLFPSRSPTYPQDSLEDVLHHEVAHVLIARAAGGRPVPRWFHEGLAMAAERTWGLEDEARQLQELTFAAPTDLDEVNALFDRDEGARTRAYTLAGAFVRDLMRQHGSSAPGEVLARMAAGDGFDGAFVRVIGHSVADEEAAFWNRHRFWTRWGPFLATTTALWMGVTVLALVAFARRKQKTAALRRRWEEEEEPGDSR